MISFAEKSPLRQLVILIVMVGVAYFFWNQPIMYPFEIITTFLHEISHAFGFLLTGGSVIEMNVHPDSSGSLPGYGGSKFFIFSSGYIGSCVLGAMIYLAAAKTSLDRWLLAFFGVAILGLTIIFRGNEFAIIIGVLTAVVSLALAKFAPRLLCDYLLRFIGLTSMLFPVYDVYQGVIKNPQLRTDAAMLAESVGGSTVMWGWIWILISLVVIAFTVYRTIR